MVEAAAWGFVGGFALVVGALIGLLLPFPPRVIGLVMAFGAGVLISAVAFELVEEGFVESSSTPVVLGLLGGAATFYAGDLILDKYGAEHRKRSNGAQAGPDGASALVLGAMLDGIPESAAIGVSLLDGGGVGAAVVAAVFLSNIPESLSAAVGLRKAGHTTRWILGLWLGVAALSAVAAAAGYQLLGDASAGTIAVVQAFAGGAILTMLADTMMPESYEEAGRSVGLLTCAGFIVAFLLGHA